MPFEFVDIHIQPDRFAEIQFIADLIQSIENLVGSCIVTVITDGGIFDHMIVFKFFSPSAEHGKILLIINMKNAGQAKNVYVSSDFQYSGFRGESKGDRFYSMIL